MHNTIYDDEENVMVMMTFASENTTKNDTLVHEVTSNHMTWNKHIFVDISEFIKAQFSECKKTTPK